MYSPDLETFSAMIKGAGLVPLHRAIVADLDTPLTIFAKVAGKEEHAFLFESMEGGEKWGRYSFIGLDPLVTFESIRDRVTLAGTGFDVPEVREEVNPFTELRDLLASLTISMICASKVSEPTFSAFISKTVFPFMVPPVTLLPISFSAGTGSPVIMLSSMTAVPDVSTPSTGIFSPGFTSRMSPTLTSSKGISCSSPLRMTRATGGTRFSKALMAELVLLCARSSRT